LAHAPVEALRKGIVALKGYISALEDFRRARRQAALEQILARLTGRSDQLLSYDEVRRKVGARSRIEKGLQEIPLDSIVGSVGRYADFTRSFLPRSDSMQERWARVKSVATDMTGWDPIEVYQLRDAYFVIDGNHRVSVARQMEMETIPAYVTEVQTSVPLTPDVEPDQLIIKARQTEFMKLTGLERTRPEADLTVTEPGAYHALEEHVQVHRYYMGLEHQRDVSIEEAAAHWYDVVYEPVAAIIREKGLLQDFPRRTETDLYLWLADHRAELEAALEWEVATDEAADDLAGRAPRRVLTRLSEKLWETVRPDEFESGPPPGEWRSQRLARWHEGRLFRETLVAVNGQERGWQALGQAIVVARREGGIVRGLHVVQDEADVEGDDVAVLRQRFRQELEEAGVQGKLVAEVGAVPSVLCDRARWNDLLVIPLTHAPGGRVLERLSSGLRSVVQRCPRPLLAVPGEPTSMGRILLAYDASAKAEEALFVTAYLGCRWKSHVVVLTVGEREPSDVQKRARAYLQERGVQATYRVESGDVAQTMMEVAAAEQCDLMAMGGYSRQPLMEIMLGSEVNKVLRQSPLPVLICR
jgi:nucleotide-binding universal stress UspA family protein